MSTVEKARINDATQMQELINYFADKGEMLARPQVRYMKISGIILLSGEVGE